MSVQFQNFEYSYDIDGRKIFVPSDLGRRIGEDIKNQVEGECDFEDYLYHLKPGGHVAALHAHRAHTYYMKFDLRRFFYSIGRNRVVRSLRSLGLPRADHYGKWSCVKNPYQEPSYCLPYGFVQSPILATLVLRNSPLGAMLSRLQTRVCVAVFMDDISLSADSLRDLEDCESEILDAILESGFRSNESKRVRPCDSMSVFNCSLRQDETLVLEARVREFVDKEHSNNSSRAFAEYCNRVSIGNTRD